MFCGYVEVLTLIFRVLAVLLYRKLEYRGCVNDCSALNCICCLDFDILNFYLGF